MNCSGIRSREFNALTLQTVQSLGINNLLEFDFMDLLPQVSAVSTRSPSGFEYAYHAAGEHFKFHVPIVGARC
jgi:hypothetical protein